MACRLRTQGVDQDQARERVQQAASQCAPPIDFEEASQCVDSAYRPDYRENDKLLLSPKDPLGSADRFLQARHTSGPDRLLRRYQQDWFTYDGAAYRTIEHETLSQQVNEFLEMSHKPSGDGPVPFRPTPIQVKQIMESLINRCHVPISQIGTPGWLDGRKERRLGN